jgi:hypothetical protein
VAPRAKHATTLSSLSTDLPWGAIISDWLAGFEYAKLLVLWQPLKKLEFQAETGVDAGPVAQRSHQDAGEGPDEDTFYIWILNLFSMRTSMRIESDNWMTPNPSCTLMA